MAAKTPTAISPRMVLLELTARHIKKRRPGFAKLNKPCCAMQKNTSIAIAERFRGACL
jgi:hypothetical protein